MKTLRIIIALCILASCSKHHTAQISEASVISAIHDITDTMQCVPILDPILALFDFEHDKNKEATLRLVFITDKKLNPIAQIHLENGMASELNNTNEEIDYRERLILGFYNEVRNAFADFHMRHIPCPSLKHSECFATISGELELLANSKASQRTLIVFSDLQENEDSFTCYTPEGQYLLDHNPGKVIGLLLRHHFLPVSLQGITIYFVYNPVTRDQDMRFSKMVALYKQLLESRGTKVVIQATNKNYQP